MIRGGQRRRSAGRCRAWRASWCARWPGRRRVPLAPWTPWRELGASVETAVDSDRTRLSLLVGRGQAERRPALWIGLLAAARIDEGAQGGAGLARAGAPQPERELARLMLGDQHPYVRALEPGGAGVNAAALRAFFDRHYLPGNATLVGTGPIAPAALARGLERWSGGSARGARPERPARQGARRGRPERAPGKATAAARVRAPHRAARSPGRHAPASCASATRRSPGTARITRRCWWPTSCWADASDAWTGCCAWSARWRWACARWPTPAGPAASG